MWRGGGRFGLSVAAPFVWRCPSTRAVAPFPHLAHRTGHADFPHPALGQDFTPSHAVFLQKVCLVIKTIGRQSGQARVVDRASGGEVIERLKARVIEPHDLVNRVVEEAADTRGADSGRLGFQI
jgi:hypothetical protein